MMSARDDCGARSICSRVITVVDAPVIPPPPATGPPAPPVAVATKPAPPFAGAVPPVSISLVSVTLAEFLDSFFFLGAVSTTRPGSSVVCWAVTSWAKATPGEATTIITDAHNNCSRPDAGNARPTQCILISRRGCWTGARESGHWT